MIYRGIEYGGFKLATINLNWIYEDSILSASLTGTVKDADFLEFDRQVTKFLDRSTASQIHLIFDNSAMETIPSIGVFKHLNFTDHPRLGWGVSYGDNDLTRFFMSTFRQVNWLYFHHCQSHAECLEFLKNMDLSLEVH